MIIPLMEQVELLMIISLQSKKIAENTIDIIHRKTKNGLSSAILNGIQNAKGETIIVIMDSDFSHPPQITSKND